MVLLPELVCLSQISHCHANINHFRRFLSIPAAAREKGVPPTQPSALDNAQGRTLCLREHSVAVIVFGNTQRACDEHGCKCRASILLKLPYTEYLGDGSRLHLPTATA